MADRGLALSQRPELVALVELCRAPRWSVLEVWLHRPHALAHYRPARYFAADQKSAVWLARRPEMGGSSVAAVVGMLPYADGDPATVYLSLIGAGKPFTGNVHTAYGERYEMRLRLICEAVMGIVIREYGLFVSVERPFLGVSLDGETNAVRLHAWTDDAPGRSRRVCWELGKLVWEAKCSRAGLKPTPLLPHLMQITAQMALRRRHAGLLHYWHRDQTRVWLVRFSAELWRWMSLRIDLAHMHAERRVPMSQASQFFPWQRHAGGRTFPGSSCADYLSYAWFGVDASGARNGRPADARPPPRTQITLAHWRDQLAQLRIREGARPLCDSMAAPLDDWLYWDSDVPGGAESAPRRADDVVLQPLPPRPEIYLLYDYARPLGLRDVELADPVCVKEPADQQNDAWFAGAFPSAARLAGAKLDLGDFDWAAPLDADGLPQTVLHLRGAGPGGSCMERLFVERFEAMPELDEPEPADDSANDTPAQRADFERRLVEKRIEAEQRSALGRRVAPAPIEVDEHGLRRALSTEERRALLSRVFVPMK